MQKFDINNPPSPNSGMGIPELRAYSLRESALLADLVNSAVRLDVKNITDHRKRLSFALRDHLRAGGHRQPLRLARRIIRAVDRGFGAVAAEIVHGGVVYHLEPSTRTGLHYFPLCRKV